MSDKTDSAPKDLTKQEKLYRDLMGDAALLRQKQLAEERYPCCGAMREHGHHPLCRIQRRKWDKS